MLSLINASVNDAKEEATASAVETGSPAAEKAY